MAKSQKLYMRRKRVVKFKKPAKIDIIKAHLHWVTVKTPTQTTAMAGGRRYSRSTYSGHGIKKLNLRAKIRGRLIRGVRLHRLRYAIRLSSALRQERQRKAGLAKLLQQWIRRRRGLSYHNAIWAFRVYHMSLPQLYLRMRRTRPFIKRWVKHR